jgi:hypothetical protein
VTTRREAFEKAMAQSRWSKQCIDACQREWAIAHDAYNDAVTEQPRKGRRSGSDLEDLRLHSISAYEALLDALRIHSDNLAHLAALKGKL